MLAESYQIMAKRIIVSLREQMALYAKHNLDPKFVLMNTGDYNILQYLEGDCDIYVNTDRDTVNGLPIVICDGVKSASITTSPTNLLKQGLL